MTDILLEQRIVVCATATLAGAVYLLTALRVRRGGGEASAAARFAIAAFVFVIALLVALHVLEPVVGYSLTCFSLVAVFFADLVRDEHMRRRRVALLTPRAAADLVPTAWIAIALLSTLVLVPYVAGGINVAAALISAVCAIAMAAIAWRVASAPTQLSGKDPKIEQLHDRACRARQVGLTCVVAIGSVALFVSFATATPPSFGGLGRVTGIELLVVWAALWVWQVWYVRRISNVTGMASA
ncbi:MAG: hypothetical protein M3126_04905 [Candidatus Eremiobacteraeota bacterium]|nr:hypothetical protein [Candidatus Eremiobacteraeota bacterium]